MYFFKLGWLAPLVSTTVSALSFREIQLKNELRMLEEAFKPTPASNARGRIHAEPEIYGFNITLPLDHYGKSKETFKNRYWVVDEYYKPGGPVFLLDVGEVEDTYAYRTHLQRETAPFNSYLRKFGAIGILWEHRFYGQSTPYPIDLNLKAEQLRYHTSEQALLDVKVFANSFQWKKATDLGADVSPKKTPWVWYGCSYSGMRAAFARDMFPETFYAAFAASAPVQARVDMSSYWEQAYRGLVNYGYSTCAKNIQLAVDYIDSQLDRPKTSAEIKKKFLGRGADKNSNEGFADTLLFPLYNWQALGVADTIIQALCANLTLEQGTERRPGGEGKELAEKWAAWGGFAQAVNDYIPSSYCEGPNPAEGGREPNCRLDDRFDTLVGISWTWQYCTEWGFFQTNNFGPNHLTSKYQTLKHQQEICHRQFPDGLKSGLLPQWPRVDLTNKKFGGWNIRPSNVFWTGGEYDPWLTLTPMSREKYAPKYPVSGGIPKCRKRTGKEVFGFVMKDTQHCYEMRPRAQYPQAAEPQDLWVEALTEWLKCF